jgi:hypothetical protein
MTVPENSYGGAVQQNGAVVSFADIFFIAAAHGDVLAADSACPIDGQAQ